MRRTARTRHLLETDSRRGLPPNDEKTPNWLSAHWRFALYCLQELQWADWCGDKKEAITDRRCALFVDIEHIRFALRGSDEELIGTVEAGQYLLGRTIQSVSDMHFDEESGASSGDGLRRACEHATFETFDVDNYDIW